MLESYYEFLEPESREYKRFMSRKDAKRQKREEQALEKRQTEAAKLEVDSYPDIEDVSSFVRRNYKGREVSLTPELAVVTEICCSIFEKPLLHFWATKLNTQDLKKIHTLYREWVDDREILKKALHYGDIPYFQIDCVGVTARTLRFVFEFCGESSITFFLNCVRHLLIYSVHRDCVGELLENYPVKYHPVLAVAVDQIAKWFSENGYMNPETYDKMDYVAKYENDSLFKRCRDVLLGNRNPETIRLPESFTEFRCSSSCITQPTALFISSTYNMKYEKELAELTKEVRSHSKEIAKKDRKIELLNQQLEKLKRPVEKVVHIANPDTEKKLAKITAISEDLRSDRDNLKAEIQELNETNNQLLETCADLETQLRIQQSEKVLYVPDDEMCESMLRCIKDKNMAVFCDDTTQRQFAEAGFSSCDFYLRQAAQVDKKSIANKDAVIIHTRQTRHRLTTGAVDIARNNNIPVIYVSNNNMAIIVKEIFIKLI